VAFCSNANAAAISWSATQNTSGPSDIVSGGTVVLAYNGTNAAADVGNNVTVSGITFVSDNYLSGPNNTASFIGANTSGDTNYDALLTRNTFGGGTSPTLVLPGLTSGQDYLLQVWFIETRTINTPPLNNRVMTYGDNEAVESLVNVAGDPSGTGMSLGQYAIGTFTADGTTQELHLIANDFGNAHFAALLVRQAIPEPQSIVLIGLGLVGLASLGRAQR
jgi:hypothetical protein